MTSTVWVVPEATSSGFPLTGSGAAVQHAERQQNPIGVRRRRRANLTVYFPALTSETDSAPPDSGALTVTRNVCSKG